MAEDDATAIAEQLGASGLYVHPGVRGMLTDEQQDAIEASLAELREDGAPVYVVVEDVSATGRFGTMENLLSKVQAASTRLVEGEPGAPGLTGLYIGTDWFYDDDYVAENDIAPYTLTERSWSPSPDLPTDYERADVHLVEDDLGDGLVTLTAALVAYTGDDVETWDAYIGAVRDGWSDRYSTSSSGSASDGGGDDGSGPGVGIGVGLVLALVVVVALIARRSGKRQGQASGARAASPARRVFTLPPSAVDLVRAARDARVVSRGREELLALGEAIDAAEVTERGNTSAWQSALDHYDAARRVLRPEDPADDVPLLDGVGGLVLAERGREALTAAVRGRAHQPTTPCFLNPLHGPGGNSQDVEVGGEWLHVPLCTRCRRDLKRGVRPEILDVMVDGAPRHYFDTDAQPWASTGYGALEPDLVTALHRVRR
ncbi:MAG TPA: hypothetical protein VGE77_12015 [Nocardioides sp.]